jgi:putative intracellular protease/amidase
MIKANALIVAFMLVSLVSTAQKKILFVMSSAKELKLKNGKTHRATGVFLSEFYLAYRAIADVGYDIDFTTPDGAPVSLDKESFNKKYWKEKENYIEEASIFMDNSLKFKHPLSLEQCIENLSNYDGVVIPGGQGLMVDLFYDKNVPEILKYFAHKRKPIGLICHAPALILSIPRAENPFIGYKVNCVTGLEEFFIERFVMKGKPQNRKIAKQLKNLGLKYHKGRPAGNFAIKDKMLVTSQNPYSNEAFNRLYIQALKEAD